MHFVPRYGRLYKHQAFAYMQFKLIKWALNIATAKEREKLSTTGKIETSMQIHCSKHEWQYDRRLIISARGMCKSVKIVSVVIEVLRVFFFGLQFCNCNRREKKKSLVPVNAIFNYAEKWQPIFLFRSLFCTIYFFPAVAAVVGVVVAGCRSKWLQFERFHSNDFN